LAVEQCRDPEHQRMLDNAPRAQEISDLIGAGAAWNDDIRGHPQRTGRLIGVPDPAEEDRRSTDGQECRQGGDSNDACQFTAAKISEALVPPNPKEFESARCTGRSLA
jgi:hypothetical protein